MKKETVIAIIMGLTLGAVIAIILIFSARKKEIGRKKVINTNVSPTIVSLTNTTEQFGVTDPKNSAVTSKETITVKGNAPKNSLLVIQTKNSEKVIKTDSDLFSVDLPISLGENSIRITAYIGTGINDKVITVYRVQE